MMEENNYDDGPAEEKPQNPEAPTEDKPMENADEGSEESESGQVATLPSSICPGMKAGEEMILKIEKVLDDSYIVKYAPKEEGSSDEGQTDEPAPKSSDPEMAGYMD